MAEHDHLWNEKKLPSVTIWDQLLSYVLYMACMC